ncbi:hypothetical protein OAU81_00180 [bacterium]|nr:hypothetical protein [bacterium]
MFDSIKTALKDSAAGNTNVKADILRFTPDNQYDLRLIPNIESPEKTFFHYYNQAWTSFCTGQYISVMSPQTFGKSDVIANTKFKLKNSGTEEEKRKADTIRRAENWLVNVYVISDPTNPENNGTVKIMRFGKQLHKIIMDCLQDTDEASVGARAFDMTEHGCNFRVKVDKQGDFPSYVTSKFLLPSAIANAPEPEKIQESAYDLENVFKLKTDDEMRTTLDEHFFCDAVQAVESRSSPSPVAVATPVESKSVDSDLEDDVPWGDTPKAAAEATPAPAAPQSQDDKLNELLAGLDDV